MKTVANRIRELRQKHNLNQTEAAMKFHMDKSTWNRIESGERGPALPFIMQICEEWHVSADYLLFGERNLENQVDLNGLPPSQIHAVKELVDGLRHS